MGGTAPLSREFENAVQLGSLAMHLTLPRWIWKLNTVGAIAVANMACLELCTLLHLWLYPDRNVHWGQDPAWKAYSAEIVGSAGALHGIVIRNYSSSRLSLRQRGRCDRSAPAVVTGRRSRQPFGGSRCARGAVKLSCPTQSGPGHVCPTGAIPESACRIRGDVA